MGFNEPADFPPLLRAAIDGDLEALTSLLNAGVDHLEVDLSGKTALHWAVANRQQKVVEALLIHHSLGSSKSTSHTSHLHRILGHVELEDPTTAKESPRVITRTPLELAAEVDDEEIFNMLFQHLELSGNPVFRLNGMWLPLSISYYPQHSRRRRTDWEHALRQYQALRPLCPRYVLHQAIKDDRFAVFKMLLRQGTDPNALVGGRRTCLHTAAMFRDHPRYISELLRHGANPAVRDQHRYTPLDLAIISGFDKVVTALLEAGISPNGDNAQIHPPPLLIACEFDAGNLEVPLRLVRKLLEAGADINATDFQGASALHKAAHGHHFDIIRELVFRGVNVAAPDHQGASVYNHLIRSTFADDIHLFKEILNFLIQHFPIEDAVNVSHENPLHSAFVAGKWNAFISLLETGFAFDVPPAAAAWEAALISVVRERNVRALIILLESKDFQSFIGTTNLVLRLIEGFPSDPISNPPNLMDSFLSTLSILTQVGAVTAGHTTTGLISLIKGTSSGANLETMTKALLDCGADTYAKTSGYDCFALAAIFGKPRLLSCLLRNRPVPPCNDHWLRPFDTVWQSSQDDVTAIFTCMELAGLFEPLGHGLNTWEHPLFLAVKRGDVETFRKLVACGANVEEESSQGWRPLHFAILSDCEPIVDILLQVGADVTVATCQWAGGYPRPTGLCHGYRWKGRPLHLAAMIGNKSIVEKLLTFGADVHAKSTADYGGVLPGHGPTPLHIALNTDKFYGTRREPLDPERLSIAQLLVQKGADVTRVAAHLVNHKEAASKFKGFESLWGTLRAGIVANKCTSTSFGAI